MNCSDSNYYTTINHCTFTRSQFHDRYHQLVKLEEKLADQGEELSHHNARELSALVKLIIKEKQEVLFKKELVAVDSKSNIYYYIKFQDNKIKKLNASITKYLELKTTAKMMKLFEEDQEYKNAILNQVETTYLDTIRALKNSHDINMGMIKILKKVEALHMDVITADIYPTIKQIFSQIFIAYDRQRQFNDQYNEQMIKFMSIHQENNNQEKMAIIEKIGQLGNDYIEVNRTLKNFILSASQKVKHEFTKLSPDSTYKVFIEVLSSTMAKTDRYLTSTLQDTVLASADIRNFYNKVYNQMDEKLRKDLSYNYDIEKDCSNFAVWKIERADKRILEVTRHALASMTHSVESLESHWKIKMNCIEHRFKHLLTLSMTHRNSKNDEIYSQKLLNKILMLQSICIQNEKHTEELFKCKSKEQALFYKEVTKISGRQKIFIQNSISGKYLMCRGEEVLEEKQIIDFTNKNTIFLVDQEDSNRIIWDLMEGLGGTMIRNTVSCQYLTLANHSNLKEIMVMGKHQPSLKKDRISIAQKYEGVWQLTKVEDVLEIVKKKNRQSTIQ